MIMSLLLGSVVVVVVGGNAEGSSAVLHSEVILHFSCTRLYSIPVYFHFTTMVSSSCSVHYQSSQMTIISFINFYIRIWFINRLTQLIRLSIYCIFYY